MKYLTCLWWLKIIFSGYLKWKSEEISHINQTAYIFTPSHHFYCHARVCLKSKQGYVNKQRGLVGTVVNRRQMGSHLLSSSSLLPCLNAGPLWRDLPILQEKFKIQILCSNSHLKILAITLKTKKTLCQPNKMFLWTDFRKGHQCGRGRPGLLTPMMFISLLHRTLN